MSKPSATGIEEKETVQQLEYVDDKSTPDISVVEKPGSKPSTIRPIEEDSEYNKPPTSARDLVTEVLSLKDDPTANPWTFRMWFIGIGISVFAA
jgi:hypothetical protein